MGGNVMGTTNPFTPIVNPSPNWKGTLNMARFGTSWKRICASRSSILDIEMDSGRTVVSSSSSISSVFVGKRID